MSCFSLAFHTFILAGCTRKLPLRPSAKISSLTGTYYFKKTHNTVDPSQRDYRIIILPVP